MMSCEQEDRLLNSVIIRGQRVNSAIIGCLRKCAVYEVCVEVFDRAFLAFLASEGHSSMRAVKLPRINAVVMPLRASTITRSSHLKLKRSSCPIARSLATRLSCSPIPSKSTHNEQPET